MTVCISRAAPRAASQSAPTIAAWMLQGPALGEAGLIDILE
jgi:hypothetical protein